MQNQTQDQAIGTDRPPSPQAIEALAVFLIEEVAPDGATLPWARRKAEKLLEALAGDDVPEKCKMPTQTPPPAGQADTPTQAMIEAGAAVVRLYNPDFYSAEEIARDAWEAMAEAKAQSSQRSDEPSEPNPG